MNRKIDSSSQPEDTEGHITGGGAKDRELHDHKPADIKGHKTPRPSCPAPRWWGTTRGAST